MAAESKASLLEKILKLTEFYFSDSNLPQDEYLLGKTMENPEGWVPVSLLQTLNRIQRLTGDLPTIVEALKNSKDLLEVKETPEGALFRRKVQIPAVRESQKSRKIYLEGLPETVTKSGAVSKFLVDQGFHPLSVRLECFLDGKPKGSAVVEMASDEEATRAVSAGLKWGNVALTVEFLSAYLDRQKEKKRKKSEEKDDNSKAGDGDAEVEEPTPDVMLRFDNLAGCSLEDIKSLLTAQGLEVAFVDYSPGGEQKEGYARLSKPGAKDAAAKLSANAELRLGGKPVEVRALEGEEESNYWVTAILQKAERAMACDPQRQNKASRSEPGRELFWIWS